MNYIEFLEAIKTVLPKHNGKVFGKRFETDLKALNKDIYISSYAGLQYVYLNTNNDNFRCHIGWSKGPIDSQRVSTEIDKTIEYQKQSALQKAANLNDMDAIEAKFQKLKDLILDLNELHFEVKESLKKKYDLDFKTYYRG